MIKSMPLSQPAIMRPILAALATVACLAAVKAMVWPVWPRVHALNNNPLINGLRGAGFKAVQLNTMPSTRSTELATSEVLGFTIDKGYELRVMRGTAKERFNFQIAFLGRNNPELKLIKRTVHLASPFSSEGFISGKQARQTCLVKGFSYPAGFGVTRDQLSALLDQKQAGSSQLRSLLGFSRNRHYECMLISIRSNDGSGLLDEVRWIKLLQSLQKSMNNFPEVN